MNTSSFRIDIQQQMMCCTVTYPSYVLSARSARLMAIWRISGTVWSFQFRMRV